MHLENYFKLELTQIEGAILKKIAIVKSGKDVRMVPKYVRSFVREAK